MKNKFLVLATVLTVQFSWAGQTQVVSTIGQNSKQALINRNFEQILSAPYFFSVPKISYQELPSELTTLRKTKEKLPLVLVDYTKIHQERDKTGRSDLGLRFVVASSEDPRSNVSQKLAESGLVQTGDIILSARPKLAGTIPYIHVQLGVTHAGLALVKKDKEGKKYVYNVDMPLNAEMLGPNGDSKLSSQHYTEIDKTAGYHTAIYHILRPQGLDDGQRENIGKWLELFRTRSKQIYQPAAKPGETTIKSNKLSFNYDYMAPAYDMTKKEEERLAFVGDLGRLALNKPVSEGLALFCSEFAWAILSLRNCDPTVDANEFAQTQTPKCIKKVFEPMPVFGSLYESQQQKDEAQFGMSDGPIVLADLIQASPLPNHTGVSVRQRYLRGAIFEKQVEHQGALSPGHLAVQAALLQDNPKFYEYVLGYYDLTALPNTDTFGEQINTRQMMRKHFNAGNKPNYSPTAFHMHALMPKTFAGQKITQKALDYVGTLYFMSPRAKVNVNGRAIDAYQALLGVAAETK